MSDTPRDEPVAFEEDGGCFGCSADNADGLQVRFRRRGDAVIADHVVADRFHGAPGIVHGGIVATLLDEVSCAAAVFTRDRRVVTGELQIRYRRPCPVESPLALSARVVDDTHPRYLVVEAEIRSGDEIVAQSSGKFFFAAHSAP
ncbi:MAG: PaaI family thioesterase [Deltaproteobacteria bacterium]|nr:PaaI family thioesterase [Deltaproteobacteria bacterium]